MANLSRALVDRALELIGRNDPSWRTRIRAALSRAVKDFALQYPYPALKSTEIFLASGEPELVLPERVATITTVFDRTNQRQLHPTGNWPGRAPGLYAVETEGNALEYQDVGNSSFISSLATDSALQLAAGASEAFEVRVSGFVRDTNASGTALELQRNFEIMTMGGTGWTATDTVWARLTGLEKEEGTDTWLRARDPTNSRLLAFIPAGVASASYKTLRFLPVPPAGTEMKIEYFRTPDEITSDDSPVDGAIPQDYLIWKTVGDGLWIAKEQQGAQLAWRKAQDYLEDFLKPEKIKETHKATQPAFTYYGLEEPLGYTED